MENLHFVLQLLILILWMYIGYSIIMNKRFLPINILGLLLLSSILLVYYMIADIAMNLSYGEVRWRRWEWYVAKTLLGIAVIKIINKAKELNLLVERFCNSKKDKNDINNN